MIIWINIPNFVLDMRGGREPEHFIAILQNKNLLPIFFVVPSKSWGVIYCPKEGSSKTHRRWKKICKYLETRNVAFDFVQSEGANAVERLASMMTRAGYGTIVVVGGDAALNHALCGIMRTKAPDGGHPVLGVIPNGFGNDFAKFWGLQADNYRETVDALLAGRKRKVDVGTVDIRSKDGQKGRLYFLNCLNLGVGSAIVNLKRKTSGFLGLKALSYFMSAFLLLFQRMNYKFAFRMSGEEINRSAMAFCIGSAHGYGQTPSAVPYNGLLDVTLVSKPRLSQLFQGLWLLLTGRFLSHRGVAVWRTRGLQVVSTGNSLLSIDGRVYHGSPVSSLDVGILPEEIEFLIP